MGHYTKVHKIILHLLVISLEMDQDSADDDEFSNVALCVCSTAESINASEDDLAHIQVNIATKAIFYSDSKVYFRV